MMWLLANGPRLKSGNGKARKQGKIAAMMGVEGRAMINSQIG